MKKIILLSFFILPLILTSQEISEEYLESLPASVKEDVLKGIDDRDNKNKPVYRRPSTMVKKDNTEFAQYKEFQNSKNEKNLDTNIRFGKSIFDSVQSSFMPINEPNLDGSYILDFGDVLEVQLIGQKDKIEELPINRDGSISVTEIGKIYVAGLSLDSASKLIKFKIKEIFIGVDAFVSLINVRDIQILISGNAYKPGMYTLNGNSNVLHAISMAGGVNEKGSYREINLIRNSQTVATLDLYDIFITGNSNLSANLRSGDTIHITHYKNLVHAVSGVNRPMIYELKDGETFNDLIYYANGISSSANIKKSLIETIVDGEVIANYVNFQDLASLVVRNNDSLLIEEILFGKVEIKGAVKMPGYYKIMEDTKLSSILKRAGGYKKSAYPFGGYLENKRTAKLNQEAKDKLYNNFIKDLITGFEILDESALSILESLKETESSGRVMAEFDLDVLELNPDIDTRLENGDVILIPFVTEQVYVYGETNKQGTVKYISGKSPSYYINNAGGYLKTANKSGLYIIHPNGETLSFNKSVGSRFVSYDSEISVYPGSIIYVPQNSNLNVAKSASVWAPIISSVATSITALSVLNNNSN